jgi:4-diphosphocytidyl-2-C-methyl-D-erythritol kinase
MQSYTNNAYAKINLSLDILGTLDNGYHSLRMVMQSISLYDVVTIKKAESGITITTNLPYLPTNENNICYKAAKKFFDYTNIKSGISIDISKRIPVGAGLGGGSSNAASVLKLLNKVFETNLSLKELCAIGATIGADVPFCVLGGTRLAEGFGEKLSPLPKMPKYTILLVKPSFSLSTKAIYDLYDKQENITHPDTDKLIHGLKNNSIYEICEGMGNVLEETVISEYSVIQEIKDELLNLGAINAQMSGSGPTVFGIFDSFEQAQSAKKNLWGKYKTVYICSPV